MQCEGECAHRESGLHLFFQYKNRYEWRGDTVREQLKRKMPKVCMLGVVDQRLPRACTPWNLEREKGVGIGLK